MDGGLAEEYQAFAAKELPESGDPQALLFHRQGRQALNDGQFEAACDSFAQALEADANWIGAWHDLGLAHYRCGHWERAEGAFQRCWDLGGGNANLQFKMGLCQVHDNRLGEAFKTLEQAADKGHLEARFQLGLQCARQRRPAARKRAIEHLEKVLEAIDQGRAYEGEDQVCFALGGLYGDSSEQRRQAIRVYRRGLAVNPLSPIGHNSLGTLLLQQGQLLGALGEFKVAIQLDPEFAAPYTHVARLLLDHVKAGDLAQEYAHIVEEFDTSAPQVLARLSLEMVERGREQAYEGLYTKGHQLKNLMGVMGSRLRGLRRRLQGDHSWGAELSALAGEQEHLYEEWVGYLGAMNPEAVNPTRLKPDQLVRRVADIVRIQAGDARLKVRIQKGVPSLEADERMLREAVTNLCLNALESLGDETGQVDLGVGYDPERGAVFIEVEDDGPGIDPEHLEYIFDPGFTTKKQGNGYGLSIARRIARAHHGDLRVKSRLGHGTVFRLDLPVTAEAGDETGSMEEGYY